MHEDTVLDQLVENRIIPSLQAGSKKEVLHELAQRVSADFPRLPADKIVDVLQKRENLGSTGIGEGLALPHGKLKELDRIIICFGRSQPGVPFESADGRPVHLFFVLLAPQSAAREYLSTLAQLSCFVKNPSIRARLMNAGTADDLGAILREAPWT